MQIPGNGFAWRAAFAALGRAISLALPPVCGLCGEPTLGDESAEPAANAGNPGLCRWCMAALPGLTRRRCRVCGLPLQFAGARPWRGADRPRHDSRGAAPFDPWGTARFPREDEADTAIEDPANNICAACALHPPAFDATWVLGDYGMPLDRLVHACKYRHRPHLAKAVGRALADRARIALPAWPTRLCAVPLAPARLRERGYNQALLIARAIGRRWQCPVDAQAIDRTRPTRSQRDLPVSERNGNVAGAFACRRRLTGERVALVDDVMTTGTTLHWASQALRTAGASSVICLVIARTPPPGKMLE